MKKLSMVMLVAVAALASSSAFAVCTNALTFNQGGYACGGYYCYIQCEAGAGCGDTIAGIQADFWSLNTGNPAVLAGDDDGSRANSQWLTRYSPAYGMYMQIPNNWTQVGIDGCIEGKVPAGHANEVMVAMFSDVGAGGGYFAAAAVERNSASSPQFNFSVGGNNITMRPIPSPFITATRRISSTQVEVDVNCPDLSGGFYSDGTTSAGEVISGCQVYNSQAGLGAGAPASRNRGDFADTGALVPSGGSGTATINCSGDTSNYVAFAVAYNSGFQSDFVSNVSGRVDCGPNVADPSPRFKLIDRKDRPTLAPRAR